MHAAICRQIESLSELAELLQDELVEQMVDQRLTPKGAACKEALQTAKVLTEKLQKITTTADTRARQLEIGGCETCDNL